MANNTGSPTTEERFGSINSRIMDLQVRVAELERRLTCPKNETANDAKSTGADASLKVHGGMSSPKSSDCCELRNSSDCSVSGGTTPSVPASRSTGGIAGTGSSDPLAEAIRAYREARKGSLDPDDLSAVGFPDTAESIRHADRLADEAEKAEAERDALQTVVNNLVTDIGTITGCRFGEDARDAVRSVVARAEKAEAEAQAQHDAYERESEELKVALAEAHKQIVRLTGEEARYRGEAEELRKSITRLQAYCQRHELSGLGTYVDDCVTAECDRLRAALKVERKSVEAYRRSHPGCGTGDPAWLCEICRAVDERRKKEATQ